MLNKQLLYSKFVIVFEVTYNYTIIMTKKCPRCKKTLDFLKFNWKIKNVKRAVYCKECSREYIKEHYYKNKDYYLKKAKKRNKKEKEKKSKYIYNYLKNHPCVDCGERDILVLEFDHKDRQDKNHTISIILRENIRFKKLTNEVAKCEVRCANCHRRKTAKENNSWRLYYAPVA